ncbi:MAG: hypothetical protein NC548_21300 [Lachnospiraceae bacterium]|nr:hypothetical protein [Lachnospiraceae bacterium]
MTKKYIESNVIEYNEVREIFGFTCNIRGESESCFYNKEFRYSTDNILWSDYKGLTNKNLAGVKVNGNKLYVQYRFTQVGIGTLKVEDISLNVAYAKDVDKVIPDCYWSIVNTNRYSPQIVYNTNSSNLFNPYNIGGAPQFYNQLSTLVSNMFGICVQYFKTEANARTRDVVLKEYSIEHVIDKQNVKILIPDNQLPTKELQINSLMIDYPVQFEIHIVKSEFQNTFGKNSHPDPHDYIYFQTYMNKMYMVDSVAEADDFGYSGSYWRVSLVPYQEMSSIKFDDNNLMDDTESLIFSAEGKFEEEMKDEYADARKDNQLNSVGDFLEGQDFVRKYLNPNIRIKNDNIYNDWTVIANSYYDLSTVERGESAVEYKYNIGFTPNDERMLSFIFRPNNPDKTIGENIMITSLSKGEHGGIKLVLGKWNKLFEKGNVVKLFRTSDLNGYKKIIYSNKNKKTIEVEGTYTTKSKLFNCAKLNVYECNNMFNIKHDETNYLELSQMPNQILIKLNGKEYYYTFEDFNNFENKWYAMVLGVCRGMSNIWIYELSGSDIEDNHKSKLNLIGKSSNDWSDFNFGDKCSYDIMSCNLKLTNIRLWSKLCEEDLHNVILSQLVVDDTHNTLIVDNAKSELLLNNKWS